MNTSSGIKRIFKNSWSPLSVEGPAIGWRQRAGQSVGGVITLEGQPLVEVGASERKAA